MRRNPRSKEDRKQSKDHQMRSAHVIEHMYGLTAAILARGRVEKPVARGDY